MLLSRNYVNTQALSGWASPWLAPQHNDHGATCILGLACSENMPLLAYGRF